MKRCLLSILDTIAVPTLVLMFLVIAKHKEAIGKALDLADEYSGSDSETAEELRERLELILDEHRKLN